MASFSGLLCFPQAVLPTNTPGLSIVLSTAATLLWNMTFLGLDIAPTLDKSPPLCPYSLYQSDHGLPHSNSLQGSYGTWRKISACTIISVCTISLGISTPRSHLQVPLLPLPKASDSQESHACPDLGSLLAVLFSYPFMS